jgi:hypothetical protein
MALRILPFLLVAMVALAVPSFAQLPQLPDPVCVPATVQSTPVLRNLQGAWGAHCLCATLHHSCLCIPQKPLLARILPPHQTNSTLQHDRHCVHTRAAAAVQAASPPYQEFLVLIRISSHPMCSHIAFPAPARSLCHPSATPSAGQTVPRPLLAPYRLTSCWVWREARTSGCTGKSSTSSAGRPAPWSLVLQ